MDLKKISIIIPVYNAESTLDKCIQSILRQDYLNKEIILIYNKSDDNSLEICEKYSINKNISLIVNSENKGPGFARNQGIKKAEGFYIYFMDSDDYLLGENALSCLIKNMAINSSDIGMAGYENKENSYFDNTGSIYMLNKFDSLKMILSINTPENKKVEGYLWNKIFLRPIIIENNILFNVEVNMWEDLLFCVEYMTHIKSSVFLDKAIYFYNENGESITNSLDLKKALEWDKSGFLIADILKKENQYLYISFMKIAVNVFMYSVLLEIDLTKRLLKTNDLISYINMYKSTLRRKYKLYYFFVNLKKYNLVYYLIKILGI